MSLVGRLPKDLGLVDLAPSEMMFWMYLPISTPQDHSYHLPDNLKQFGEIISMVRADCPSSFFLSYVYLTAKTLWVAGEYIGNRPGWHVDGYGTEDVNFIWADRAPTEFIGREESLLWSISDDCDQSMQEMELIARKGPEYGIPITTYPDRHLLRLDNTVIHRSPVDFEPGYRTFIKVSLSHERYNLKGNSINHRLPSTHWPLIERGSDRNHPTKENP
jgi:hypothetical protein